MFSVLKMCQKFNVLKSRNENFVKLISFCQVAIINDNLLLAPNLVIFRKFAKIGAIVLILPLVLFNKYYQSDTDFSKGNQPFLSRCPLEDQMEKKKKKKVYL